MLSVTSTVLLIAAVLGVAGVSGTWFTSFAIAGMLCYFLEVLMEWFN